MKDYQKWLVTLGVTILAIVYRVQFQLPNFSPVLGLGLVLGYFLGIRYGLTAILASMVGSDIILASMQTWTTFWGYMSFQPFVYGSYALILGMSYFLFKKSAGVAVSPVVSSLLFFLITNFAVWLDFQGWGMYTKDISGLMQCFTMAIPFYRGTFLSDMVFTYGGFGVGLLVKKLVVDARNVATQSL